MGQPVISISSPDNGAANQSLSFTANVSNTTIYLWNFGDDSPTVSTQLASHKYSAPGTYQVTLTVTVNGQQSTVSKTISIVNPLSVSISSSSQGVTGQSISFTATPTGGSAPYNISWDFKDGTPTVQGQNQSHQFQTAGTYNVTVSASDSQSRSASSAKTISISSVVPPPPPPTTGLLHKEHFTYVGCQRVPNTSSNGQYFSYSGTCLAYNPVNKSLFIVGGGQTVGEITIVPPSTSASLGSVPRCTMINPLTPLIGGLNNPTGANIIGGLLPFNGALVCSLYVYYDNSNSQLSHFTASITGVKGLFQVGSKGAGFVAGYMCPIPSEWQAKLGEPYITGLADIPIISRTSAGPCAFGFDPSKLGSAPTPAIPYVYYDLAHTQLGPYEYAVHPIHNASTQINGVLFVPNTSCVLFFGTTSTSYEGYGLPDVWGDVGGSGGKGPHSLNGEYAMQVWAYDANDFVAVRNGTKNPWELVPYDVWNFTLPFAGNAGGNPIGGVAFDAATGRLFLSVLKVDCVESPYDNLPVIYTLQLSTPSSLQPRVGTLTGMPITPKSGQADTPQYNGTYIGPVSRGDSVLLTAGNVYSPSGSGVRQVDFFMGSQYLGTGTKSTIPFGDHNYQYKIATSALSPQLSYQVSVKAMDSNGNYGPPTNWTLKIK